MNNIPIEVLQRVNTINIYKDYSVVTCTTVIPYIANTLKNIYLCNHLFTEFQSTLFQNKNVFFSYYFNNYIENNIHNIHHPVTMNVFKSVMYKSKIKST